MENGNAPQVFFPVPDFTDEELKKLKRYLKQQIKGKVYYHVMDNESVLIVTSCIEALAKLG